MHLHQQLARVGLPRPRVSRRRLRARLHRSQQRPDTALTELRRFALIGLAANEARKRDGPDEMDVTAHVQEIQANDSRRVAQGATLSGGPKHATVAARLDRDARR